MISPFHLMRRVLFRIAIITPIASLSGWLFAYTVQGQTTDPVKAGWYEHPAIVAGLLSMLSVLAMKGIDVWREARREAAKLQSDKDLSHLSLSERLDKMSAEQLNEYLDRRDEVHREQVAFLRSQNVDAELARYEYKEKHVAAMNEVGVLQKAIAIREIQLTRCGTEFEPTPIKTYFEIMREAEVDRKVEEHRIRLDGRRPGVEKKESKNEN